MKKFSDVVIRTNIIDYLNSIHKKSLLIYSPTSSKKINLFDNLNNNYIISISTHVTKKEIRLIENVISDNSDIKCVIGFGGGTAIDVAKYIAYKMNIEIIAIPSMLSTNVYSTDKVLMIDNGIKNTLDSKLPDIIIYDDDALRLSLTENLFGFSDVLTIYTASRDWILSCQYNNEKLDDDIYKMDVDLVNDTIKYILNNSYESIKENLFEMFNFIGMVGHITNLYGCGRPVSGSEHIFAKDLEQKILVPHGISVAIGILIMSLYQNNYSLDVEKCFEKLKILDYTNKFCVTQKVIMDVLNNLKPRKDRYSVVNLFNKNDVEIHKKILQVLDKFKIKKD